MSPSKLSALLLAALALAACAEKQAKDPIPSEWAKADCQDKPSQDCPKARPQ